MIKKVWVSSIILIAALILALFSFGKDAHYSNIKRVQAQEADGQGVKPYKEMVIAAEQVINGETKSGQVHLIIEDAPEIPDSRPDASGLFLRRSGDTIILGSGSIEVSADIKIVNDHEPVKIVHASHYGAAITFQVNDKTRYLRDESEQPEITPTLIEQGEVTVPGTTALGSLDEIGRNSVLCLGNLQGRCPDGRPGGLRNSRIKSQTQQEINTFGLNPILAGGVVYKNPG